MKTISNKRSPFSYSGYDWILSRTVLINSEEITFSVLETFSNLEYWHKRDACAYALWKARRRLSLLVAKAKLNALHECSELKR